MEVKLFKWSGAGNLFVIADGRDADVEALRIPASISRICAQYATDGLMILNRAKQQGSDFDMEFYNPDGSGGMMCGNGGRCIVAFADMLGVPASKTDSYSFTAPDGLHEAAILERPSNPASPQKGERWTVRLHMIDVEAPKRVLGGLFLDTGTRHFVKFVEDVEAIDIEREALPIRRHPEFAPEGTNVNFVQVLPDGSLKLRTFEKGVEGETAACGTGITASALVAYHAGLVSGTPTLENAAVSGGLTAPAGSICIHLHARRDSLTVDFRPAASAFTDVYLTGPAELL